MNYGKLMAHVKEFAEGKTVFATFAAKVAQRGPMPEDRIGMAEKKCFVMRTIAQARMTWCRHLDLISDDRQLLSPATAFKKEPQRFCKCWKHGYESPNTQTDADALIAEFKNLYCCTCSDRQPLRGGA